MKTTITQNQIFRSFSRLQRSCCSAVFLLLFLLSASSSWGQIAQRGTATTNSVANANGTTIVVNKPTGVVTGDLMILSIVQNETDNGTTLTSPSFSGWTLVKDITFRDEGNRSGDNVWFGSVYYKFAVSGEASNYTLAMNSACDMALGSIVAFSGVATNALKPDGTSGGPFDIVPGSFNNENLATATATGVTIANNNSALVMIGMVNNDRTYSSWSDSLVELFDHTTTNGDDTSIGAAWTSCNLSGSTGDRTVTISGSDRNSAILLALRSASVVTVGSPSSTPTLCSNSVLTNITHTTTGASGIGTATGLPAGISASYSSNTITISGTPTESGTFNYSIPVTPGCVVTSGTITVLPKPTSVTASASASTICSGGSVNLTSGATSNSSTAAVLINENFNSTPSGWTSTNTSSGGTPANAAWTLRANGYSVCPSGCTGGSQSLSSNDASQFYLSDSDRQGSGGTTTTTLKSPAFSTVGLSAATLSFYQYYRDFDATDSAIVEVSTNNTSWTTLATYTSTDGTNSAFALKTISLNSYLGQATVYIRYRYTATWSYYWAIDNVSVTGTYSTAPAATFAWASSVGGYTSSTQNPTGVSPSATTTYTVTATNNYGCSATASTTVNVNPTSVGGSVAGSATVCTGTNSTTLTLSGHTGSVTKWQSSTSSTFASGITDIANTTTTLTATNLTATTYYRAVITSGVCSAANSSIATVTVTPTVTISAFSPATSTRCQGAGTVTTTTSASNSTGITYSLDAASITGGNSINASTGAVTYAAGWSGTTTITASAAGCNGPATTTHVVTVNPTLNASVSIASDDADNTICSGTSVTFTATPTNGGTTPSYQWKVNGTNAGTNAATFTSTTLANNDVVTCVMTSNATPCLAGSPATSNSLIITINTRPNNAIVASNVAALCGGTATLSASTNDANVGVKWYNSANSLAGTGYTLNVTPQSGTILTYYAQAYNLTTGCTALNNTAVQVIPIKQFTGSGNWDNASSWTCGSVPTANDQAVIPSGSTVTIASADAVANTLTVGGSLTVNGTKNLTVTNEVVVSGTVTVNSNANLLQINPNAANSGNITVNRNSNSLNRLDYTLWSSPVLNRNLFGFSTATVTTRFYMYDTANRSYVNKNIVTNATLTSSDVFQIGRGYLIRTPNNWVDSGLPQVFNGVFTGKPNNGTITVPLVDAGSSAENKYNLVGNPYPSAISIDEFVRVNQTKIDGTIYLWRQTYSSPTSSAYCVFNSLGYQSNGDANAGDPVVQSNTKSIPVGQGFFVKAIGTNSGASVEFNNDMRVASSNGHFHRTMELEKHRIWLNATSSTGLFSQMLLGYVQDATNGVDSKFDGTSMGDGSIVLTSTLEAKQYAIQGRALPFDNQDIVPLSFKATTAGNYTFTLAQMDGLFAAGQDVFIKDKELEKIHNLKESAYTFSANAGTFANRFEIVFQATLTDLQANSCGSTIANMNSLVYADLVNGATGYRFKVVNNTTSAVQTIDRPQHWFAFNMLSAYDYNTPYTISVQVQKDGVWTGYYGATCTVNSPNIAATGVMQINPSQCGMTLPTIGTVIATTPVAGATGYKFRITNTTAGAIGNNLVQEITRTNHWFTLAMLSRYNYGSSYAIEVAVKTSGAYTPYGNACTVYAPAVPTLASCGQTVATSTTLVRTTATNLATQYRFQVTRIATQETITFDTANYWFSFRVNVPGYAAGEQYGVRVAVMTAGAWSPYGDACDITAPIATARTTEEAAPSEANLFKPVAYPNPFASTFGISLATPSADVVHVMVYDLQGRLIEKQNVFVSQLDSLQIGTNYPSGDYLLVVAQGANIKSSHIHKE